jgi:KAP family P-loop domain/Putative peptidoglycan binding domain
MAELRQRTLHGAVASTQVREAQEALRELGLDPGPIDGIYGAGTSRAVAEFQRSKGLEADAVIGPQTWSALRSERAGRRLGKDLQITLRGATAGDDVLQAQSALRDAGFDPGELDGVFGPDTEGAVLAFQRARGLVPSAVVDEATWGALATLDRGEPEDEPLDVLLVYATQDSAPMTLLAKILRERASVHVRESMVGMLPGPADRVATARVVVVGVSPALAELAAEGSEFMETVIARAGGAAPVVPILLEPIPRNPDFGAMLRLPADLQPIGADENAIADAAERVLRALEAPAGRLRSWFPGYASDSIQGRDRLGIQPRVDFLASVLAAKALETPLAIGLFGNWGSGKSFFMSRLSESIGRLAESSATAEASGETSYYCSHVQQVAFNAWLYSEGEIWPSFAAKVFRSVSGIEEIDDDPALSAYRQKVHGVRREIADSRRSAETEEDTLDRQIQQVTEEIASKRAELVERTAALGPEADAARRAAEGASGVLAGAARIRRGWPLLPRKQRLLVSAVLAAALAAAVVTLVRPALWSAIVAVLLPLATIGPLLLRAVRYLDEATRLNNEINRLTTVRGALQQQRQESAQKRARADARLESFDARDLLPDLAAEQAARWTQRERLSVVTEIRLAFERLSRVIEAGRQRRPLDGADVGSPPLDRVVIYVDDLDRCKPAVVVQVLEAIKLLLDLPHFVVVVGVDSRWLFRSLEMSFPQMLASEDGWTTTATPQSYLKKIFQYSLVLPPMTPEGYRGLVESLLPVEEPLRTPSAPQPADRAVGESRPSESDVAPEPVIRPAGEPAPSVDLTPQDLVISSDERDVILSLGPLLETPRSVKRLTNLYRLIRVAEGGDDLVQSGDYVSVLILLSIAIGYPEVAERLLPAVVTQREEEWGHLIDAVGDRLDAGESATARREMYEALKGTGLLGRPTGNLRRSVELVAEFSFFPWPELD